VADELAIHGGTPVRKTPFPWPRHDDSERQRLQAVLESGHWAYEGPAEKEFERAFARYLDVGHALTVSSGTTALEIALQALDLGPGDEVIVPALTWTAPARAIVTTGATPVFADIDEGSWCLDPEAMATKIGPKTRAVVVVHTYSQMADLDRIMLLAEKHDLAVIEDCAHAHGSAWRNHAAGTIGRLGCFSFQSSKPMTAGEGGMVVTDDDALADRVYSLRNCGRPRSVGGPRGFGGNFRMTDFQAAILLSQLDRLDQQIDRKADNLSVFEHGLSRLAGLSCLRPHPGMTRRNLFALSLRLFLPAFANVPSRSLVGAMAAEGIPVFLPHEPVYRSPLWRAGLGEARLRPGARRKLGLAGRHPTAELIFDGGGVVIAHEAFLGSREDTEDILTAFEKVQRLAAKIPKQVEDHRPI
jgi:dTDP-4-amino-4,6-dideoxygalactose transaminase